MSIKQRIGLVVISAITSLIILSATALYQSNNFMMFLLKDKIHALTDVAVGVAKTLNTRVVSDIDGYSKAGLTFGRYGKRVDLVLLNSAVKRLTVLQNADASS